MAVRQEIQRIKKLHCHKVDVDARPCLLAGGGTTRGVGCSNVLLLISNVVLCKEQA